MNNARHTPGQWRPITDEDKGKEFIITEQGLVTWLDGDSARRWGFHPGWFLHDGGNCLVTCADSGPFGCSPQFTIDPPEVTRSGELLPPPTPDLLEALELLIDATNACCPVDHPAFGRARAAIAKARGNG